MTMKVDAPEVQQLLAELRALATDARAAPAAPEAAPAREGEGADFSALLARSLDGVSRLQHEAARSAAAFEAGEPGVDLAEVMVAMQKARVSFEAVTQVRNRLVRAYQDVLNMPV